MESLKSRNVGKLNRSTMQRKEEKESDIKFTEEEKKTIGELKKLYLETIKLDVDLQRDIYNMEKSYEAKHNEIFDRRRRILDGLKSKCRDFKFHNHGDANPNENVTNFWLKVLKASYTEFISKKDEKILSYLSDIRSKLFNEPSVNFIIEFYFEPNEYFSNRVLTKTYFLNCLPDPEEPLSYDGAEIYKCEGCRIDWKQPRDVDKKNEQSSFFDFFSPPDLPEDPEDQNYCDINAILQNDFELGFYLKERVIPKAIIFFTGEIADCQSSDTESESEESDEESDADEEEESSTNENDK